MKLFVIQKNLSEGVVRSQIITLVNYLNKNHISNYLMLSYSEKTKFSQSIDKRCTFFYSNLLFEIKNSKINFNVIYVRSEILFLKLYLFRLFSKKKFKLLYDFRGLSNAELYAKKKSIIKWFILNRVEYFIYKNADYIHCVSNNLKNWLISNWGYKEIKVIPCCTINRVHRIPKSNKNINFVYVGSISFWQKIDKIINLYISIEKQIPNTVLTIITNETLRINSYLKFSNIKNYQVKSLNQENILSDLTNYDFGFLLRDNILMNNISSPVKFAEYVSRGVIPILSEGIGDYSNEIKVNQLGIIVDIENLFISRNQIEDFYHNNFNYDNLYDYSKNYIWESYVQIFNSSLLF